MCITEDHLSSREGWSQLESVDGTNWPSRMKLWFKRNTRNLSMGLSMVNLKMSQLLSLER